MTAGKKEPSILTQSWNFFGRYFSSRSLGPSTWRSASMT